jgi:drug/metabolite transporter (DMT)-like permease
MRQVSPHYLRGAVFGLAAVSIWAGWSAMTRLAVITNLDAWDIPALRFGVAGLLLLPHQVGWASFLYRPVCTSRAGGRYRQCVTHHRRCPE